MRVEEVCNSAVVSIREDATVVEAARRMRRFHVGDLVVVAADSPHPRPVGMVTDRDLALSLLAEDLGDLDRLTVGDLIRPGELVGADADEDVVDAVRRMRKHGVRRLPVTDDRGVLVGIFTLDDALAHLVGQLHDLVEVVSGQRWAEARRRP